MVRQGSGKEESGRKEGDYGRSGNANAQK